MTAGHVMEIFSAIQGEGPFVGVPQIFFRLYRCNLRCAWCDTPESFELSGPGQVENPPGGRRFDSFDNPISPELAMELLAPFISRPHHSISFTGGEPLLQPEFLKALFPLLKEKHERIFLETGGSLPEILEKVIDWVDIVSMDLKLPSSAKERPLWEKHEEFLRIASRKECYVKIVLTRDTLPEEFARGVELVKRIAPDATVILQPVTPLGGCEPPGETELLARQEEALRVLRDVRVIPQVHKLSGQK